MTRDKRKIVIFIILLVLIITLFLPIKLTYKIKALGRILPEQEWYFVRSQDDSFLSEMYDYKNDAISNMASYKFERGDIATINLFKDLKTGMEVHKGDTLGYIHSYLIENEIEKVKNQITTNTAQMIAESTGAKQSEIESCYQKLLFAEQTLDLEKKNFNRVTKLFNDSIIARVKYEESENKYKLAEIEVSRARYDYESSRSGEKPAEIKYYEEQINAFEVELGLLENLKNKYYIISPINGFIYMHQANDKIFSVNKLSDFILEIPVKASELNYLKQISSIQVLDPDIQADFLSINHQASHIGTNQIVIVKAIIKDSDIEFMPGMFSQINIFCDDVSLITFLKRNIFSTL